MVIEAEKFYQIPGYEGKYEINYYADIRRIWSKSGKHTGMKPSIKDGELVIRLLNENGKRIMYKVSHLMAMTFIEGYKKGVCVYHINGVRTDNIYSNLRIVDKKTLGKLTGSQSKRKPVVKIDLNGEAVEFYQSAREAARKNHMSYQTVMDYCNKKNKRKIAPDGYMYEWADSYE